MVSDTTVEKSRLRAPPGAARRNWKQWQGSVPVLDVASCQHRSVNILIYCARTAHFACY